MAKKVIHLQDCVVTDRRRWKKFKTFCGLDSRKYKGIKITKDFEAFTCKNCQVMLEMPWAAPY